MKAKLILLTGAIYLSLFGLISPVSAAPGDFDDSLLIRPGDIGFEIPSFEAFMSFLIKFFFVMAGLLALFYMLWGAISWITSGGEKDAVGKSREKILAAVIGVMLIIATLSIIVALEQIVFKGRVCFGLTCELRLPTLLKCPGGEEPNKGWCKGDLNPDGTEKPSPAPLSSDSGVKNDTIANGGTTGNGTVDGTASNNGTESRTVLGTGTTESDTAVEVELPVTGL